MSLTPFQVIEVTLDMMVMPARERSAGAVRACEQKLL